MALQNIRQKSAAAAGVIGLGALLVGCGANTAPGSQAQAFGAAGAAAPMAVACEPNQRAIVRQAAINGVMQSQVQCETVAGYAAVGTAGGYGVSPVAYQPGFQPVSYTQPTALEPTRIVRTAYPQQVVTREVAPRTTSYQRARARGGSPAEALGEEERDHHRLLGGRRRRHRRGGRRQEGRGHRRAYRRRRRGALGSDHEAEIVGRSMRPSDNRQ